MKDLLRRTREAGNGGPVDPRDAEISRLKREVEALRRREESARAEAQDARKHFADLTAMSRRFASSMRLGAGERQQQRRRLAAQYAVSQVLNAARDLDEAAPKLYEILGERLGWSVGILWKLSDEEGRSPVLRRAGIWRSFDSPPGAFEEACEGTTFRRGIGLPGRVWERGKPLWVENFLREEEVRAEAAAEDGLRGALAFPIVDGGFAGVFELLRGEVLPPDEDLMRIAGLVGGQIAQFLERRRAEEERDRALHSEREARERTTGVLESINDAFYTLDGEERFTYVNNKAEAFWGRAREELLGRRVREAFPQMAGSEPYRAVQEALREGAATEFEAVSPTSGIWISGRVYPSDDGVSVLFHSIEERKQAEGALRRSEGRFRAVVQNASDVIAVLEVDGTVRYHSPSTERVLGYGTGELVGRNAFEYVHSDDVAGAADALAEAFGGASPTVELRFSRKDGSWCHLEVVGSLLEGSGVRGSVVVSSRDVTERKRAEEALTESEARLSVIFSRAAVGLCEISPEGSFVMVNDELCEILGRSREELLAAGIPEVTHPDNLAETMVSFEGLIRTGEPFSLDKRYVRPDGTTVWANSTLTRLDDEEGRPRGALAVVVDLTERMRAETAVRESEERFRAVANLVPDLLWSNDDAGYTSWCNRRWLGYTGQTLEEARGYGWLDAIHPDDREGLRGRFRNAADGGGPFRQEHRIRRDNGEYRWFLVQAQPLKDDAGEIVRWFGAATDIHEQRTAMEALKESEELYRSLAEATSSVVWTADRDGSCVEKMPAWEEFTGQTFEDYRGYGWLGALHPEDRPPEELWKEFSSSDPAPMEEEYRLRWHDGGYRRVMFRGVPIVDEGGKTREWVGTMLDVEDARRAEEEREELRRETERERARLEGVLQQMPGGVFIADSSGSFVLANEGARRIYGREIGTLEECSGHTLSYPQGEKPLPNRSSIARALVGETVSGLEHYVVHADGTRRVVRANAAPVRDERGNVVAAVKAFEDVTAHKEAEEERDHLRMREREARDAAEEAERCLAFYAGAREERQIISRELHDRVAHSIAVVRQNLELYEVLRDRNPEAAASKMEVAKEEAKATLKSTRDLSMMLRCSEVEDGMAQALTGLEETTVPMGVCYESTVAGDESLVPPHVGNQVFLILREAVRNAVNHSGCSRVSVRLEVTEERVIGTVEDDGRGFEPDEAQAGGGLRSMEERASLVGGELRLRSIPDDGAEIEVSVPLNRAGA